MTQKNRCVDAQGTISVGRGDQYETYWFRAWIIITVVVEVIAFAVWLVIWAIRRLRRGALPPAPASGSP